MNTTLKVNDCVMTPDGRSGYVTEVHAKGKTAKVCLFGYYPFDAPVKYIDTYSVKTLTPMSRKAAWKIAPRFPGIDC